MAKGLLRFSWVLMAVLALAACASVSVQSGTEQAVSSMPEKIYVMPFDTSHGDFKVDRENVELVKFKRNLQNVLQAASVADLSHRLIPAVPARSDENLRPENAWVIRGEFTRVNQGSRLLRAAVGFGAGGTKMETNVYVYDLRKSATTPFLTFSTTGGSGAEPGAVTAVATDPVEIAIQAAASGSSGITHGVTEDAKRTAREITAEISDFMYRSGWIPKDKWIKPKKFDN